jgi:hypothetical protein
MQELDEHAFLFGVHVSPYGRRLGGVLECEVHLLCSLLLSLDRFRHQLLGRDLEIRLV